MSPVVQTTPTPQQKKAQGIVHIRYYSIYTSSTSISTDIHSFFPPSPRPITYILSQREIHPTTSINHPSLLIHFPSPISSHHLPVLDLPQRPLHPRQPLPFQDNHPPHKSPDRPADHPPMQILPARQLPRHGLLCIPQFTRHTHSIHFRFLKPLLRIQMDILARFVQQAEGPAVGAA